MQHWSFVFMAKVDQFIPGRTNGSEIKDWTVPMDSLCLAACVSVCGSVKKHSEELKRLYESLAWNLIRISIPSM